MLEIRKQNIREQRMHYVCMPVFVWLREDNGKALNYGLYSFIRRSRGFDCSFILSPLLTLAARIIL